MSGEAAWVDGPTFSVWIYDSPRGASAGKVRLARLSQRRAVVLFDAATVMWFKGAHRPRIGRSHMPKARSATGSSPLDVLLGRLLFSPRAVGDHVSTLAGELSATGVGEEFLRELSESLVPDMSALLVLSLAADVHEVQVVVERGRARGDVRHFHVTLTGEELAALEEALERMARAVGPPQTDWR